MGSDHQRLIPRQWSQWPVKCAEGPRLSSLSYLPVYLRVDSVGTHDACTTPIPRTIVMLKGLKPLTAAAVCLLGLSAFAQSAAAAQWVDSGRTAYVKTSFFGSFAYHTCDSSGAQIQGTRVAAAAMPAVAGRPTTRPPVTLPTVSSWPATTIRSSSARPATAWRMRSMAKRTLAGCLPPAIWARARWSPRPAWKPSRSIRRARRGHHRVGTRVRLPVKRRQVAAVECGGFLHGTSVSRTVTAAQFAQARPLQAPAH